jgi:hypothetical protein
MSWYHVVLAIASGAVFDTGERVEMRVQAVDRLDAAIIAEKQADALLDDPVKYSHTRCVTPIGQRVLAMAA